MVQDLVRDINSPVFNLLYWPFKTSSMFWPLYPVMIRRTVLAVIEGRGGTALVFSEHFPTPPSLRT